MARFTGKVAIVTGGASGIGAAVAREFAAEGAAVAIFDINVPLGESYAAELQAAGYRVRFHRVDVSEAEAVQAAVAAVASEYGSVNCLVNCAVSFTSKGIDVTTAEWERSLGVNVRGTSNTVQACYPHMKAAGGGAVVNIASISAHIAQPDRWTYNATKGAIVTLSKCQALDLAPAKIRVNVVSPGWVWTPEVDKAASGDRAKWEPVWGRYHMLRRLGQPAEVARAVLFLCSDDASFITAAELPVDGGYLGMGSEGLGETSSFAGTQ
ncbi:MAG: glucose 1-dehydrogenase [Chloroflexi bacterium]|nr:glucose 1-dehydrogenase [Chloroflexota bacterium]MCC6893425.1 glucose 1-dehydrogenase [Anaerolineae bacterium]